MEHMVIENLTILLFLLILALEKHKMCNWEEKLVGFGSDGAAVMVGEKAGVSTNPTERIPWLVNIQCLAHGLEIAAFDTIKAHD